MVNFTTYGMAGIGIAAAIGFVFALSILSNNNTLPAGPDSAPQPLSTLQQKSQPPEEGNASYGNAPLPDEGSAAKMQAAINNESTADNQLATDARPTLDSIVALNGSREIIGEVAPQMEFKLGSPVFIQANFANNNEADITQHAITMDLRSQNGGDENTVSFNGGIARGTSIALEFYWQPDRTGDFTIVVFSMTPGDLHSTQPVKPVAAIPVRVVG
ncbi:MAG TPA: hypothetical protein VHK86_04765 [Nitrososphaera sp.]|jgi:hypothetical protein|nr:hypothetical protein [Nitrososphaera sp.]